MSYQKLLEQVARVHNATLEEVDSEMRTALQMTGYVCLLHLLLPKQKSSITTIKKICDGLDITITDFFDIEAFRNLEQEIK